MSDKLPPEEDLKLENLNLAVEREEIYTRMDMLNKECTKFKTMFLKLQAQFDHQKEELRKEQAQGLEDRTHSEKVRLELELEVKKQKEKEIQTQEQNDIDKAAEQRKYEAIIKDLSDRLDTLLEMKAQMDDYDNNKTKTEARISQLVQDLDNEKKARLNEVTEKEREKLQATEKLRREMLTQIKKTKASLLALNDDQLQTTTRLTILQNTQLTVELEYQSKQTEKLLVENNQKQQQIDDLNRKITIHKEVEKELAKRSHFCQKVIKRLKAENKEIIEKLEGKGGEQVGFGGMKTPSHGLGAGQKYFEGSANKTAKTGREKNISMADELKSSEELINYLENKLEQHEKNLLQKKTEYEALQNEYYQLQDKFSQSRHKYKRAALIMTDFLEDMINKQPNILQGDKEMHLNLEKIKDTPFENLPAEDKVTLALVLLKQLQPYLSAQNLSVAPNFSQPFENKGSTVGQDKQAISQLLKNVNVQQRRSENLPPIQGR